MNPQEIKQRIARGRDFLRPNLDEPTDYLSDQQLKRPQPPLVKAAMREEAIGLPSDFSALPIDNDFLHVINTRASHRVYTGEAMSLRELSYLLWCTQGVKEIRGRAYATLRTVPCGGARHEFETYIAVLNVEGLKPGIYHYLPMTHQIELLSEPENLEEFVGESLDGQTWGAKANAIFYYSVVNYRAEWRYGIFAHRIILVDAGHITENLYLAATSIGLGSCAIGAVNGKLCDETIGLDGEEEFIIYAHTVGKISPADKDKEQDFYAFVKEQNL